MDVYFPDSRKPALDFLARKCNAFRTAFAMLLTDESKEEELSHVDPQQPYDAANRALMPAIVSGDKNAFEQFYDNTSKEVYSYCLKLSRSKQITEEIMQQAYIAFWQQRERNANLLYPKAYLVRICSRMIWKWFAEDAKKRHIVELNENVNAFNIPYQEAPIESKEIRQLLEEAISALPPKQQKMFRMNKLEGFTYQQIMEEMNVTYDTVDLTLRRAMAKVRKRLIGHNK
jgi:RNA polymerase sigma-70 factor (ECF subfamily)